MLPLPQGLRRVVVGVAPVPGCVPRQDQPDHVVRVGREQLVLSVVGDDVVRWRCDLSESGDPVPGITDSTEGFQREPALRGCRWIVAGRKDLHICQKDQPAARIPAQGQRAVRRGQQGA